ncbi:MAG: glycosyltransferase, partial [Segetibacter sp.]
MSQPKNNSLEIPLGKRTLSYRFFEMLPALLSFGAIILLIVLSLTNPLLAAAFLLLVVLTTFVKALGIAIRTIQGYSKLHKAQKVNWQHRLEDISYLQKKESLPEVDTTEWKSNIHMQNLQRIEKSIKDYPKASDIYNAVIIATYNEGPETLEPTIRSVINTSFPAKKTILVLAYEERGGQKTEQTVRDLKTRYGSEFFAFELVKHPKNMPNELVGKGGNITYAGHFLENWLEKKKIATSNVIVTTLDSDNRPAKEYFSIVTYEYIVHPNRHRLSFQPISLFLNNIWDVPAPMRVIATGNSFWNIICSVRPHTLRNFASHSQGMQALKEMNFWSVRTIVEDGHQYWRSYFFFKGNYNVIPIYIPIYQDAVLSNTYAKTLKAQFIQLRRWAYGASDVPYVATRVFTRKRTVPFISGVTHFFRLLDSHVTLASTPLLVAFGGWVPLFLNNDAARSIIAHELPEIVSQVQRIALIGIFITVFLTFKMLPPRPERYKRHRSVFMLLQ